jgi:hypothetical protein
MVAAVVLALAGSAVGSRRVFNPDGDRSRSRDCSTVPIAIYHTTKVIDVTKLLVV